METVNVLLIGRCCYWCCLWINRVVSWQLQTTSISNSNAAGVVGMVGYGLATLNKKKNMKKIHKFNQIENINGEELVPPLLQQTPLHFGGRALAHFTDCF
jgi:hypothetical protein